MPNGVSIQCAVVSKQKSFLWYSCGNKSGTLSFWHLNTEIIQRSTWWPSETIESRVEILNNRCRGYTVERLKGQRDQESSARASLTVEHLLLLRETKNSNEMLLMTIQWKPNKNQTFDLVPRLFGNDPLSFLLRRCLTLESLRAEPFAVPPNLFPEFTEGSSNATPPFPFTFLFLCVSSCNFRHCFLSLYRWKYNFPSFETRTSLSVRLPSKWNGILENCQIHILTVQLRMRTQWQSCRPTCRI